MRVSKRAQEVSIAIAQVEVQVALDLLQREHDLTDVEMLQAITSWQALCLKYMLRSERHPDNPDKCADEE